MKRLSLQHHAAGLIGSGLAIGMAGYHSLGRMSWVDSFYYASMILAGEGPPADRARRRHRRFVTLKAA